MGPFASAYATYGADIGAIGVGGSLFGHPLRGSDHVAAELEGWQFVTEEGPSVDAFVRSCMIEADDVASARSEWPQLTEILTDAGVRSVCSLPLMAGPSSIGALTFYRDMAGPLGTPQLLAATALAELVAATLSTDVLEHEPIIEDLLGPFDDLQRATGVVMAHLAVSPAEAVNEIRALCIATRRSLQMTIVDIIGGRAC